MAFFADYKRTFVIGERATFHCPPDLEGTGQEYGLMDGRECLIIGECVREGRRAYLVKFDEPLVHSEPWAYPEELSSAEGVML